MPLAYFITFSTYGTWLHGTDKAEGSVDRNHKAYATPFVAPNAHLEAFAADRMTDPPYILNDAAQTVVRDAIVELCTEKAWILHALHVRTNHVHCVISADRDPGRLMSDLKSRASRNLNQRPVNQRAAHEVSASIVPAQAELASKRAAHEVSVSEPLPQEEFASEGAAQEVSVSPRLPARSENIKRWTRHGSTRHLFDEASLAAAIHYALEEQGPKMAHYKRAAHEVSAPPTNTTTKEPRTK